MHPKFKSGQEEEFFNRELDGRILPPPKLWEPIEKKLRKERDVVRKNLKNLVEKFIQLSWQPKNTHQLELAQSSFDVDEIWAGIEVILDGYMTMGQRTYQFEQEWSKWLGVPFSVMVNSGSSANLLAMSVLAFNGLESHLKPGDEVIVPSVAWSTSIFPVAQVGCVPVFVDVDLDTANMSVEEVRKALSPKTRAIIPVHILGNPCDMKAIMDIAREHNLFVLEDCCESHGAEIDGQKVGTWGDFGTFSFFFSHHITTVEGGMVSVKDKECWGDALTSMRAHGWVRGRTDREELARANPGIDDRWLFVTPGYNVRPTDINAAFGQVQLRKLNGFITARQKIRNYWIENISGLSKGWLDLQHAQDKHSHSAFGFAIRVTEKAPFSRKEFRDYLESRDIQTRPLVSGNFILQPVMKHFKHRIVGKLPNATKIHNQGLMVSNFHNISPSQQNYFLEVIEDFLKQYQRKKN